MHFNQDIELNICIIMYLFIVARKHHSHLYGNYFVYVEYRIRHSSQASIRFCDGRKTNCFCDEMENRVGDLWSFDFWEIFFEKFSRINLSSIDRIKLIWQ